MIRLSLILLAAASVCGCNSKSAGPDSPSPRAEVAKPGVAPDPAPPSASAPVAGTIGGQAFVPDKIVLEGRDLLFRKGAGFFADMEIRFALPEPKRGEADRTEWKFGGDNFGDPTLHISVRPPAKGANDHPLPQTEFVFASNYRMTLKLVREGRAVTGTIDLTVTGKPQSTLRGTFKGEYKKTPYEPLDADDAPYVTGGIRFVGPWTKERISVGFVGTSSDGKERSNSAGTEVSAGSPTFVVNSSFQPQITSLTNDAKAGPTFHHTKMAPGNYVVFATRQGVVAAWKKVAVKANDRQVVDLTMDLTNTGDLVVHLPDDVAKNTFDRGVILIPDGIELPSGLLPFAFPATEVKAGQKTATIKGVPAGKYRVFRNNSEATVEVLKGKATEVTLGRKPEKK